MAKRTDVETAALVEVGRRVAALREQRALSQERLAQLAHLDRTYIGTIEQTGRNLRLGTLLRLARALEVNAAELVRDVRLP